ncbi:MAG TPA: TonB-dependent receptor [Vicinamibacterales bacterium]|nr:TonB-dependent receptor [Vicinamibacterales bacterium]
MIRRLLLCIALVPAAARADQAAAPAAPAAPATLAPVTVIGVTPLPGVDMPRDRVPAPVQTATGADIAQSGALSLGDFMNRRFGSVHVNEIQGNPWQPDVSFRGYTASPLLGTPQGLSVYVDGIRFNQPFGDIVSWDLLPTAAIASIALMPGSNPLFGLNTLGGALSVQTKDGATHPGTAAQVTVGGHGRGQVEVESGGKDERGLSWFGVATAFRDNGWRDDSGSRLAQAFGKLGWRSGATHLALTVSGASTTLLGNGLQDGQLLAARYASVYTRPDETRNRSGLVSIAATHERDDGWSVSGRAYLRRIDTRTVNGDLNDDALDQPLYGLSAADRDALAAAGIAVPPVVDATTTPFPYLLCVAQALQGADTELACNGVLHRSRSRQSQGGVSVQATRKAELASITHQLVVGAAFDASRTHFSQSAQAGFLRADRAVETVNDFLGGGGVGAAETTVSLDSRTGTASVFAADSIGLGSDVHLTAAARYDRTTVANRDALQRAPDPSSLDGDHRFARLNPALGINWNPSRALQVYAGYSEGSRTPTAIELGCANPAQPCKLPNAMAGDPPLRQVVARTVEAGVRGELAPATTWRAGVFRGVNRDDLLFVSSDASGQGYFRNFGKTRRQGIELGAATRAGAWSADFAWTLLDARFMSSERVDGTGNSSNDEGPGLAGAIDVVAGDRLPLIPRQTFKASLAVAVEPRTTLALDLVAASGAPARGNENGGHAADGVFYLGPGRSPGYAVVNFGATMQTSPALTLFARIANVLDRQYASAAQLGPTGFDAAGRFVSQPFPADAQGRYALRNSTFYAPGAPRLFSLGLRYAFD